MIRTLFSATASWIQPNLFLAFMKFYNNIDLK